MPSPFPGMDPYVEKLDQWSDFRLRFNYTVASAIEGLLGERLTTNVLARDDSAVMPDGEHLGQLSQFSLITASECKSEVIRAVIEVVTPWHKRPGIERDNYLAMRVRLTEAGVDLLEIDLLCGGDRLPLPRSAELPRHDYCVAAICGRRSETALWPIALREQLPVVPVEVGGFDQEIALDLQSCFDDMYDGSGYRKYIYLNPPEPPLQGDDALWARQLLSKLGRDFC